MRRITKAAALAFLGSLVPAVAALAEPACDRPFTEVFREVAPAVVRVFAVAIDPFSQAERVHMGTGSGLVIDDRGHVVTNAHVVFDAGQIAIAVDAEDMRPAEIVGIDPISDLAVLRLRDRSVTLTKARLT